MISKVVIDCIRVEVKENEIMFYLPDGQVVGLSSDRPDVLFKMLIENSILFKNASKTKYINLQVDITKNEGNGKKLN